MALRTRATSNDLAVVAIADTPAASADSNRPNDGVVANVYTIQHHQHGCDTDIKINPQLRPAARWAPVPC